MIKHLFCSIVSEVFALERLKTKGNFQLLAFKSGHGRLTEVVAYRNFKYGDLTWKLVAEKKWVASERWSQPVVRKYIKCGLLNYPTDMLYACLFVRFE